MEINISEYSIKDVQKGQPVKITADILGDGGYVQGEIASISPTGEIKGDGSSERVIPTKIRIRDSKSLIAGITAKAEIVLNERNDTYTVPISSVGQNAEGTAVMQFVRIDNEKSGEGTIVTLPVETGIESDLEIEIINDPTRQTEVDSAGKNGARYITVYDAELTDGTKVKTELTAESENVS